MSKHSLKRTIIKGILCLLSSIVHIFILMYIYNGFGIDAVIIVGIVILSFPLLMLMISCNDE